MSTGGGWGGGAPGGPPAPQQPQGGWGQPQGGPGGGYQPQPPQQSQSASGMAIAALICGVGSWLVLPFVAAVAGVIIAKIELGKIDNGESPEAGRSLAQIGYWASIANIVVTLLGTIAACCLAFVIPMVIAGGAAAGSGM